MKTPLETMSHVRILIYSDYIWVTELSCRRNKTRFSWIWYHRTTSWRPPHCWELRNRPLPALFDWSIMGWTIRRLALMNLKPEKRNVSGTCWGWRVGAVGARQNDAAANASRRRKWLGSAADRLVALPAVRVCHFALFDVFRVEFYITPRERNRWNTLWEKP